jgi:hypothetical protein
MTTINAGAIGKSLVVALLMLIPATVVAGLAGWLIVAIWHPREMVYLYVAGLTFLFAVGAVTAGVCAGRFDAARPYLTAALAGAVFEVVLLLGSRQDVSPAAGLIGIALAVLIAIFGAWLHPRADRGK